MENKRSLKYLVVASCLALLIASIGGIVVGAGSSPAASDIKILGATLDLNDEVAIGYVVDADAVGYNTSDGTVQYYVHTYNYNPTGTADEGTKLTNYVYKDYTAEEGDEYVIFITEGYPVAQYADDVFARVIEGDKVGTVKKAGIYELSQLMLKQGVSEDATNLIGALVKYHDAAYKVLNGTASPYKFVTVSDGYIVEDGFEYNSGVYAAGDTITLVDKIDSASKGAVLKGWTNGTDVSNGSVVTVSSSGNYEPQYQLVSDVAYNPLVNGWYADIAATIDGNYNTLTTKNSALTAVYWNSVVAGVSTMGIDGAIAYRQQITAEGHDNGFGEIIRYVYRDEATGEPIIKHVYNKTPPLNDEGTAPSKAPSMGATQTFSFVNQAVAGQYVDVSFDIMFPDKLDKDGDGDYNELYLDPAVVGEDDDGNEIVETPLQYGDYFTHDANGIMIRVPIDVSDSNAVGVYANNLMYIHFIAQREDGHVTGFYPQTAAGPTDAAGTQCDKNGVAMTNNVYSLGEYHTVTARIIADNNGLVSAVELYIDGDYIYTRTAAAGLGKSGLSEGAVNGNVKLFGEGANSFINVGAIAVGRYTGDTYFKNYNVSYGEALTSAEVAELPDVSSAVASDTVYPVVHSAATKGIPTAQSTLGDPILGVNLLRSYNDVASWVYDAKYNSYTVAHTGSGNPGAFNLHVINPGYGVAEADRANTSITMEFNMTIPTIDYDRDNVLGERYEFGSPGSTVLGFIYTGFGDGSNGNATPAHGMLTATRIQKSKANYEKWHMSAYGRPSAATTLRPNVDGTASSVLGGTALGVQVNVKIVYYPDANGLVQKYEMYINDVLMTTRTQDATDVKSQMPYLTTNAGSAGYDCSGNIYDARYLNFSYQLNDANRYANLMISDMQAYITALD